MTSAVFSSHFISNSSNCQENVIVKEQYHKKKQLYILREDKDEQELLMHWARSDWSVIEGYKHSPCHLCVLWVHASLVDLIVPTMVKLSQMIS